MEESLVILEHLPFSPKHVRKNETLADALQRLIETICLKDAKNSLQSNLSGAKHGKHLQFIQRVFVHFPEKTPKTWKSGFISLEKRLGKKKNSWEYFSTLFLDLHADMPQAEATPFGNIKISLTLIPENQK